MARYPIASLPLPPASKFLTAVLTGEPIHPSVPKFQSETLNVQPSLQRQARIVAPSAHFSYATPLPRPFPYNIPKTGVSNNYETFARDIEDWLKKLEPLVERPLALSAPDASLVSNSILRKFSSDFNESVQERHLLSLSSACINDCLPALDVGDAMDLLGVASLVASGDPPESLHKPSSGEAARQELIDVLSGHSALMSQFPGTEGYNSEAPAYAPWSLCYSGHQFGTWAGQLGDGRAISICAYRICFSSRSQLIGILV
jgi:serine/tyrosine/threonine adenylyltransferase